MTFLNAVTVTFSFCMTLYLQLKVSGFIHKKILGNDVFPRIFFFGACDRTRTSDLLITNELHYQLCYTSIKMINCR